MNPITFEVLGVPQPGGSKRAFALKRNGHYTGRTIVTDANAKAAPWKTNVAYEGSAAMALVQLPFDQPLLEGPLEVRFVFRMPRLKSHYHADGRLRANAPARPEVRPDVLKLARSTEDALTGVIWRDDAQIVIERLEKVYSDHPGATITISRLGPEPQRVSEKQKVMAL